MPYVASIRPTQGGGSGQSLNFVRETFELNSIPPGTTINLSPGAGFEIDANTIVVNYNEKLLLFDIDYTFTSPNFIELQFSDNGSGDVAIQVQYTESEV